jgi:hypothetical protein
MSRTHPLRRVALLIGQTAFATWAWNNRNPLMKQAKARFKNNVKDSTTDTSRPVGDRYVPPVAGPGPTSFEAAKAEEAPGLTPGVTAQAIESNAHVSIVVENA